MRVVAGRFRSRRLRAVKGSDTRPTTDRARAGLFDWLGPQISGRALDLFAGTGALGIEALSRGCHQAVFVERARGALATLRANLSDLDLGAESRVMGQDVGRALRALAAASERFDLILVDPPYQGDWDDGPGQAKALAGLLEPSGVLIVERATRSDRSQAVGLVYRDSRNYGETTFDWFEPAAEEVETK